MSDDVKIKKIETNKLFASIKEFCNPIAKEKSITINLKVDNDIEINSDENIIRTVMRNLISNAIKFTNNNGSINIVVSTKDDLAEICVEDNGVGITEENAEKLFRSDMHFSSNGTNNERGTGMGLALCYDFLQLVNGKIWVTSKINEGSKFYFSLPKNEKVGEQ